MFKKPKSKKGFEMTMSLLVIIVICLVLLAISILALIIVSGLIYVLINKLVLNRIHKVSSIMEHVSKGDLTLKIT